MRMQWTFFYDIEDGAWLRYEKVPLGDGYRRIRAVYGNDGAEPSSLEVRLDRLDGPLAGTLALTPSDRARPGHVQIYREAVAELGPAAKGTRDVFLVFRSAGGKPSVDFEYFRFEQYRGELPLQKNEVKLELREGSASGPKLGEFYPRGTGDRVGEFVANLEPAQGAGPLVLVVRSALAAPVGAVYGLRLEKSTGSLAEVGLGLAPRQGMLPQPTHRPRPAPADHDRPPLASRPFQRGSRVASQPVLDGQLQEWTGPALELRQSLDGLVSDEPPARAWVGYDEQAFYVAMRMPQPAAQSPRTDGHEWGATDGVEIAFQNAETTPAGPS
jgi:hypothetical protein